MKKIISLVLSALMIVSSFSVMSLVSAKETNVVSSGDAYSGTTGDCTWNFDEDTGTLTISGEGDMEGDMDDSVPWNEYSNEIKKIVIEDGVTSIGDYAFVWCSGLTSITIPDSVTSIGEAAFLDCSNLISITIPDGVTSIGDRAFEACSSLTSIDVGVENKYFSSVDGNLYNKAKTEFIQYAIGKNQNDFVIPNSVTNIIGYAFYGCSSLTSITIPDGVTYIGYKAFYDCSSLTSITIPDGVTYIGDYAFEWCSGLTSITIPDSVTSINNSAFGDCSNLTSITIPDSVTSIGYEAFRGCSSLTSVTIPDSVTSIDYEAFRGCSSLTSITIPDSVTYIREGVFLDCSNLISITIPDSVTSINNSAFEDCLRLTSITIPDSVTYIGDRAFYDCSSLTSITIPNSVTSIGIDAFYSTAYYNDKNNWDNGLLYINNYLIKAKYDIENCSIKDGTKLIANSTFEGCSSLTSVTIPDSVTYIGYKAFYDCSSLKNVYYSGTEEQWKSIEIGDNNELLNANITYNYVPTEPTTSTTKPTVKKVAKVTVNKKSVVLVKGRSTTVKATVTPANATNKKLKWTTSNSKVATVSQSGKITAKGRGIATIKAMSTDGSNKYATLKVTVKQPVTSVKLNKKSVALRVKGNAKHKTVTLKAKVYPNNANNKTVKWSTSKSKIATVNSKGKVIAKKKGTCYIIATAKDGSKKSAKCKITVK